MNTPISIHDEISEAAERTAGGLGMSESELYSKAVAEFVALHSARRITEQLDAEYRGDDSDSALDPEFEAVRSHSLADEERW